MSTPRDNLKVHPLIRDRWSPRAFDGSAIDLETLEAVLEGARWAPSAFNAQPWRFIYALRGDAHWQEFLSLLIPYNEAWASSASALLFVASERETVGSDGKPRISHSHSFDAGAAWALLSIEALARGLHTHGMSGVKFEEAAKTLGLPDTFRLEAAVAIGRIGDPAQLPEALQARETPSDRRPLKDIYAHGRFAG